MTTSRDIRSLVNATPFVDTHEHLMEESVRIAGLHQTVASRALSDFTVFFAHYADSDLHAAGMSLEDHGRLLHPDTDLSEKWRILEPVYEKTRHTGYFLNVRESLRALFGMDDVREENYEFISQAVASAIQPGFYETVLKEKANIEYAQVNALEVPVFRETEDPSLLAQDIGFISLATDPQVKQVSEMAGIEVSSLKDWHEVIDWCFSLYGPRAIAVKNQSAYARRIDYALVSAEEASPLFDRYLADPDSLTQEEMKAIQDHLFHYCVDKAVEYVLPVKLHTGYYAGTCHMPLNRVRKNAGDMCDLLRSHPGAKFVIMHMGYPYQDEMIAVAKHYPNAYIDMCWAWIINPMAGVRFVKEYLMAAPANKLLTFGGDYLYAEMVPGHARIARKGLAQALSELVDDDWIDGRRVPELVDQLMRGNAHAIFDHQRTLARWGIAPSMSPQSVRV